LTRKKPKEAPLRGASLGSAAAAGRTAEMTRYGLELEDFPVPVGINHALGVARMKLVPVR
jgi:hypothetical protein